MCHKCVMETVKSRMLSRRQFMAAAPALTVGSGLVLGATQAAQAQNTGRIVDLTYVFDNKFPTWTGSPGIKMEQLAKFEESGFNAFNMEVFEHTGTHVDAPLHFSADGLSVEEIPVENLICPLCVIDIKEKADANIEAEVTPDDLMAWISRNGDIPDGACVAMNSGWQRHVNTPKFAGFDDKGVRHYPGFHVETAHMLMEQSGAVAIATDSLSFDIGSTETFDTHYAWLPTNRYGIENIANLDQVPEAGATIFVGAPTHRGGSGGPARVIATF
ncbi:cyclase family protein [Parasedimentitalea psychrophila]|uniref:Cyclase family protein n=1 Tax=Parasedimentitalea psychrophila TaxID=2997337 RepID=A0A9Y2P3K0_9RHOB|nr:cyclase family protein [Parasedimentitalea psychrophila]WIY24359.1 cyclase family protein [Parasedimentitalea psychrophila]